jgi:monovalent cation:H+ antiporter-2, CPA2 family
MVVTPFVANVATWLEKVLEGTIREARESETPVSTDRLEGHVLLARFGRVGRTLTEMLERQSIGHLAVDADPTTVHQAREAGRPIFFGDASPR